jgi:uncharacterized protein (DUF885 family)
LHDSWSTETLHHLGSQFEKRNTFFVDIVPLENEADYRQYLSDIQREAITLHTEVKSFLENT